MCFIIIQRDGRGSPDGSPGGSPGGNHQLVGECLNSFGENDNAHSGRPVWACLACVTLTDGAPALLPVLRKLDGVEVCLYNFAGGGTFDGLDDASAEPSEPSEPPEPADLVLGAEIAYRAADAEALAACIPLRLAPGGTAVLCSDEKRAPLKLCGELLRQRGFVVEDSVLTLTVTPDVGAATTHRVRVVRARRSSSSSSCVGAS